MFPPITPDKIVFIEITKPPIRLGQFLKFAGIAANGLEAKHKIQNGDVSINGQVEVRRGRRITIGDRIMIGESMYIIKDSD